jgi:hypothetical protein
MCTSRRIGRLAVVLWLTSSTAALAALQNSVEIEGIQDPSTSRLWVYTATIGLDWAGFPERQYHNYLPPGILGAVPLDHIGRVYLTGRRELDENGVIQPWQEFITPIAIDQLPWMNSAHLQGFQLYGFLGYNCCWYSGCPLDDPPLPAYQPSCGAGCYQGCVFANCSQVSRRMFEIEFPLDEYGNMRVVDAHGGSMSDTWCRLQNSFPIQEYPSEPAINTQVVIYLGWLRPASYQQSGDCLPGARIPYWINHRFGPSPGSVMQVEARAIVVHHSTADVSWASRGAVDASDLGVIGGALGKPPCYGLGGEPSPGCTYQQCAPWYADLDANGCVDASDLSRLATVLGTHCTISKSDPQDDPARVLAWFGLEYSGRTLVEWNGAPIPEVRVADEAQLRRAVLDPYGYRRATASGAVGLPWGRVKVLYR